MRILLVHPGASISTADVWSGLSAGLKSRGHEVYDYALDGRLEVAGQWFAFIARRQKKRHEPAFVPSTSDVIYKAGEELVARALRVLPDVVIVVSAMYLHPDTLVLLRRAGLKVAILFTESPYDDEQQARLLPWVTLAWTNERVSARTLGTAYLPHAINPDVHTLTGVSGSTDQSHDVVFVGTGFQERIDTLAGIDWTGIDLGLYGAWDLLGSRHALRQYVRGGFIENARTVDLYRRAKIGLNFYRTSKGYGKEAPRIAHAESLNPRAYELAATGCFTISDARAEVAEKFGDLVPTFTTAFDASALIRAWLADDVGRARVRALLPHCVAQDTWADRVAQMEDDLTAAGIRTHPALTSVDLPGTVARVDAPTTEARHLGG